MKASCMFLDCPISCRFPHSLSPSQKPEGKGAGRPWVLPRGVNSGCRMASPGRWMLILKRVKDTAVQHDVTCDKPEHLRTPEEGSWGPSWGHCGCQLSGKGDGGRMTVIQREGERGREEDASRGRGSRRQRPRTPQRQGSVVCRGVGGCSPPQRQPRRPPRDPSSSEGVHHPLSHGERGEKGKRGHFPKGKNLIRCADLGQNFRSQVSLSLLLATDQQREPSGAPKGKRAQ